MYKCIEVMKYETYVTDILELHTEKDKFLSLTAQQDSVLFPHTEMFASRHVLRFHEHVYRLHTHVMDCFLLEWS